MYYGAAKDCADFVYLAIGTGLGGGAVVNGDLILGTNFFANEVGHLSLDPDGRLCACGQRGCIETYLSGVGFNTGIREHRADFPDSPLAKADQPDTAAILDAARAGDPLATLVIDEAGRSFGAIMACCAAVLNPTLFVIGGGLGHAAADLLFDRAERELKRRVLPPTLDKVSIVLSQVTDSAIGAASLVWHHDE
jgi:glucokinase